MRRILACCLWAALLAAGPARADTLCTALADAATGAVLVREGECDRQVSPASTFKIALALIGYDAGLLTDLHTPAWPAPAGGGQALPPGWDQTTDPTRWIANSVVWYSQRLTRLLGPERLAASVTAFGYGNADLSGDPGRDNGLTRAWLGSSLRISPREQLAFLSRLVNRTLPVSAEAMERVEELTRLADSPAGWEMHGKTGTALWPERSYGWFVGWARSGSRTLVFARLIEENPPQPGFAGGRARAGLLADFPRLAAAARAP